MWQRITETAVLLLVGAGAVLALLSARLRRRCYDTALRTFLAAPAAERTDAMRELIQAEDGNAPAWYLLGCSLLRAERIDEAARAFGMAHHRDGNLQTAALLTFACLKTDRDRPCDIIEQILTTWQEMQRPDVLGKAHDRRLLDCLSATTRDAPRLSPLGRLMWLVTGPAEQSRIEKLLATDQPRWSVLRE